MNKTGNTVNINTYLKYFLNLILILSFFFLTGFSVQALDNEGELQGEPYILNAENINYDQTHQSIYARDRVVFEYTDFKVEAETLNVDINKKELIAEGKEVVLHTSEGESLKGSRLEYDYENGSGKFYDAESEIQELRFKGGVINLVQDQSYEMEIEESSFTPCIVSEPHYQFQAESVRIYPDNKIVGRNIGFIWGNTRLFTLPAYVLLYEEVDGEYEISHPFPLPEVSYDSAHGISFYLNYPYQIGNRTEGKIITDFEQRGEKSVEINNDIDLNDFSGITTDYTYAREEEDGQEELPVPDREYIYTHDFYTGIDYSYSGIDFVTGYRFNREKEDNVVTDSHYWSSTLGYRYNNFQVNSGIDYNLKNGDREEEFSGKYNKDNYGLNFSQEYLNENIEKESYSMNYSINSFDWNLAYRDGYDLDYYPYLTLNMPQIYNIGSELGWGIVGEDNTKITRKSAGISLDRGLKLTDQLKLDFKGNIVYNLYGSDNKDKSLVNTTSITGNYNQNLTSDINISSETGWKQVINQGEFIIDDDKKDAENLVFSSTELTYKTPEPQSAWNITGDLEYSLEPEEWEEVSLGVKREYDCYSFNFNYEIIDDIINFGINF